MKLSLTISKSYKSVLSKTEIVQTLEDNKKVKKFGGLRMDKYAFAIKEAKFEVQRYSSGLDVTLESFPLIKGEIVSENPTQIDLRIIPNYFSILFFSLFVFTFIPAAIFINKMNVNHVYREPTFWERVFFGGFGGGIPGLWCYLQFIRPIKKSEKWIVEKLMLSPL